MGIYPTYRKGLTTVDPETGAHTWTEYREEPGHVDTRTVTATPWVEAERTDCYCCSCGDSTPSDPHCRNHGWDGERPCEFHKLPGVVDEDGVMPDSVQARRTRLGVL